MFRQFKKQTSAIRRKLCPKLDLEQEYEEDDIDLIHAYANIFVIVWTFVQVLIFVFFITLFLASPKNEFMQTVDCCNSTQPIYDDTGFPLESCSQNSCKLYEHVWLGGWNWGDDRPRKPEDGATSTLFDYDSHKVEY